MEGAEGYDVVMIHGDSVRHDDILTAAVMGYEDAGRTLNTLVYLGSRPNELAGTPAKCISASAGGGHLKPAEIQQVVNYLTSLS